MASNPFGAGGSFWQSGAGNKPVIKGSTGSSSSSRSAPTRSVGRSTSKWANKPDPMADLEAWLASHDGAAGGGGGGGYGGGGGGGGGNPFGAMRANADQRYAGQRGQLDDLYGDYAKLVEGNPAATKKSYDALIAASAAAGKGISDTAVANQKENNSERDAALQSLGVSPEAVAASPSAENVATQEGLSDLALQNSSWGNLQGVLSNAQQARDRLDIQGVGDAKVLAHRQLTQNYEDFMRQLDQQLAASMSGGGGGGGRGGGGGGSSTNKYRGKMEDAIFDQLLINAGYKKDPTPPPTRNVPTTRTSTKVNYDASGRKIGSSTTSTRG